MNQQLLLESILKSSVNGIMVLKSIRNSEGGISDFEWISLNDAAYSILKYQQCHLTGKKLLDEMPEVLEEGLFFKFINVIEKSESVHCELCLYKLRKEKLWLNLEIEKQEDEILIIFQDYTSIKNTENQLREKEKKYKQVEAAAHVGFWELDITTKKVTWSDEIYKIFGFEPQSFEPTLDIGYTAHHPEDRESTQQAVNNTINHHTNYKTEKRILRPNGEIRWVISEGELVRASDGTSNKVFGYILDITDRIESEIKLKKSENLFRSIFYGAGVGIALVDLEGKLFKVNPKLCSMLEYSEEELSQMSYDQLTYPEDLEKDTEQFNKLKAKEIDAYEIEKRYVKKSGKVFWRLLTITVVYDEFQKISFVIGRIQDINQRKIAEWKLEESERRFKAIFNSSFQFTGLLNPEGILLEANKTAMDFAGVDTNQVIGKPFWETYWWQVSDKIQEDLKVAINKCSKGEFIRYEVDHLGENGKIACIDFSLTPILDESGKVVLMVPEGRDITERKEAEKKLAESEKQFKLFVNQAPIAIAMFDKNMNYLAASQQWLDDYEIKENIIGRNHYEVFPEIGEGWKSIHRECLKGKVVRRLKDPFERQNGTVIWLRWELRPWYDYNNQIGGMVIFTENITEDIRQEETFIKLNRELEELNQQKVKLFSIIAHDIKGPIANCMGLLDVVSNEKEILSKEELLDYLKMLQKSAYVVSELVEELLIWAQTQFHNLSSKPEKIALVDALNSLLKVLNPVAESKSINIELEVDATIVLWADRNMVNAILRNLISNSIKFTKAGGCIQVKAEKNKDIATISIIDNGIGIKEENLDKIFDARSNFTTYGTSGERGTGLGLDLCQSFVNQIGGQISVRSKEGLGSTFSFTVPLLK